jgi:uncharacterized membrane protein YfcA
VTALKEQWTGAGWVRLARTAPMAECCAMPIDPTVLAMLAGAAGLAGVVDAIAGGGGLLTMPALLMAGLPPHEALATNKGQSVWGAASALLRFWRSPLLDRSMAPLAFICGLLGAMGGVCLVQVVPPAVLKPLTLVLLVVAAVLAVVIRPRAGGQSRRLPLWVTAAVAGVIGAYDGFFGPGTGTFLILAYALLLGRPLSQGTADAKVVNFASNLAALAVFAAQGVVRWPLALTLATAQFTGAWAGSRVAMRGGDRLVRWVVLAVVLALILKLGRDALA